MSNILQGRTEGWREEEWDGKGGGRNGLRMPDLLGGGCMAGRKDWAENVRPNSVMERDRKGSTDEVKVGL